MNRRSPTRRPSALTAVLSLLTLPGCTLVGPVEHRGHVRHLLLEVGKDLRADHERRGGYSGELHHLHAETADVPAELLQVILGGLKAPHEFALIGEQFDVGSAGPDCARLGHMSLRYRFAPGLRPGG